MSKDKKHPFLRAGAR
jgi:hypothetical protein